MSMQTATHPDDRFVSVGGGTRLCYREHGDPEHPTVLLIHGLGMQLVGWPQGLVDGLVAEGLHVVRFDNRDIGRSSQGRAPAPRVTSLALRRWWHPAQYSLDDMAADTAGLIEALQLSAVHAVGVSMGGMIGQMLAARYPEHVASLTSISSMTGRSRAGGPARSTWLKMATPPATDRETHVHRFTDLTRHIASHGFPFEEGEIRELAAHQWDRGPERAQAGVARQLAAIMKSGDRTHALRGITAPTLVIHGDRDRMVHPSGGAATADAIPGARLETIHGMGHDLPAGAWPQLLELITTHVREARPVTVRA